DRAQHGLAVFADHAVGGVVLELGQRHVNPGRGGVERRQVERATLRRACRTGRTEHERCHHEGHAHRQRRSDSFGHRVAGHASTGARGGEGRLSCPARRREEGTVSDHAGDDREFSQSGTLRDGTPVTIRAMRPDDRERLVAAFGKLDSETIYTRFFSPRREIPERALERIAEIDFEHLAGLVVTLSSDGEEAVIASATYVGSTAADGAKVAEVAFTVEEDYQ